MVAMFEYRAATSVQEAVELLANGGEDAKVLAGGQSLVPLINLGLAQPSLLVDINEIPALDGIQEVNGSLAVGTLVRHAVAEQSEAIKRSCPLLAEAVPLIGDRQVRNRGTIGGSIAHADPVAEMPTVAVCLDAKMRIDGPSGSRDVPASEFFVSYLTTALEPADLLTAIWFPVTPAGTGVAFKELVRRKGDFAIVAAAAAMELAADGTCRKLNLALAGVGSTPVRAAVAEEMVQGQTPAPDLLRKAAAAAAQAANVDPQSDVLASAAYRRAMVEVYARRAMAEAAERATPGR
jgi:aerobic carbon-monoxide dehydrogenase medium subunit